jgi:hypothetical protein
MGTMAQIMPKRCGSSPWAMIRGLCAYRPDSKVRAPIRQRRETRVSQVNVKQPEPGPSHDENAGRSSSRPGPARRMAARKLSGSRLLKGWAER